jgi:hypothetical protein
MAANNRKIEITFAREESAVVDRYGGVRRDYQHLCQFDVGYGSQWNDLKIEPKLITVYTGDFIRKLIEGAIAICDPHAVWRDNVRKIHLSITPPPINSDCQYKYVDCIMHSIAQDGSIIERVHLFESEDDILARIRTLASHD